MSNSVFPVPRLSFDLNDGAPAAAGTLTFYQAGTVVPLDTFSDEALSVANPNPLTLNSAGRPEVSGSEVNVYGSAALYDVVVRNAAGTVLYTAEDVAGQPAAGALPSVFVVGDLVVADSTSTLTRLPAVAAGQILASAGVGAPPAFTASPSLTALTVDDQVVTSTSWFNVKNYGATGDGSTDDTAAIQSAITACVAGGGGVVFAPPGQYVISRLDLTEIQGLTFQGAGTNVTRFNPKTGTASYGTSSGHLFDCTGSLQMVFRDLQVGFFNQTPEPTTAFFFGQIASGVGNQIHLENLYVSGSYTSAPIYIYGVPSSTVINCDFYNYNQGAGTHAALQMTQDNIDLGTLTSDFATVTTGDQSSSDWTFIGCEFHKFAGAGANNGAIYLDGADDIRFYGGNMSGGAEAYIFTSDSPINIIVDGTTFGTEGEAVTPTNVIKGNIVGLSIRRTSQTIGGDFIASSGTITGTDQLPGGQLEFPATQNPSSNANTFDDYQEATWTPVLTFTTPGDLAVVYSAQAGAYTKWGRVTHVTVLLATSTFTHTTASGNLLITGFPFAANGSFKHLGVVSWSGITKANYTNVIARFDGATATIDFTASGSAQSRANVTAADMPTTGTVLLDISIMLFDT